MKRRREVWKIGVTIICTLLTAVICVPVFAEGLEISVTGGIWETGPLGPGDMTATSGDQWTISGSSDGSEDIDIRVSSNGAWSANDAGSNAVNEFGLREDNSSGKIIKSTNVRLVDGLASGNTYGLDLWYQAPATGSEGGSHTLNVILTASGWVADTPPCGGYATVDANGLDICLYFDGGAPSPPCRSVCGDHGGECGAAWTNFPDHRSWAHFMPLGSEGISPSYICTGLAHKAFSKAGYPGPNYPDRECFGCDDTWTHWSYGYVLCNCTN